MKDLYKILGVSKTADTKTIKKSYRSLAKKYHPDHNPDNTRAQDRFKEVNSAFEVLGDEEKRKLYDEFGEMATKPNFNPEQARQYTSSRQRSGGFNFNSSQNFSGQDDFLSFIFGKGSGAGSGFGGFGGRSNESLKGKDYYRDLHLELLQATRGDQVDLAHKYQDRCPHCGGSGSDSNNTICTFCFGQGTTVSEKHLKVRIPPGTIEGNKIRIKGHGQVSDYGGQAGDLILTIYVKPHKYFYRKDDDIHIDLPITIEKALFGCKVKLTTPLDKTIKLTVPNGSKGDTQLRVRGHGVQKKGSSCGDFIIHLHLQLPDPEKKGVAKAAKILSRGVSLDLPVGITYIDQEKLDQ
jgi:molecular chaperone DnaJ